MIINLLTETELEALTGYSQSAKQIRWLQQQGIHYFRRPDGSPSVTWHFVNHPRGAGLGSANDSDNSAPDFGAISNG